jgi:very-short-patch-repair endonuclease
MEMIYMTGMLPEKKYIEIAKNYYAVRSEWIELTSREKHIELCACVVPRRKQLIFTGQSTFAIFDISQLENYEMRPHCIRECRKSKDFIRWHYGPPDPNATWIHNCLFASPIRAICDMALLNTPASLLVSINHCLNKGLFTKDQFFAELRARPGMKGRKLLMRLLEFATEKCESPLETIAWIALYKAQFKMPGQQVRIYENHHRIGRLDMLWELRERKIILELDGRIKYLQGEALFKEKRREDKLRSMGYEFIRGDWEDVQNGELVKLLRERKIPIRRNFGKSFPG